LALDLSNVQSPSTTENLTTLVQGLESENPTVRHTTEDVIRHLLTKWVLGRSPSQWHEAQALDDFFRLYKKTNCKSLKQQLSIFNHGAEEQYLSQI